MKTLREMIDLIEMGDQVPDWLIDLYDENARLTAQGGRGASPADKRRAAMSNKRLLKGIAKWLNLEQNSPEFSNALLRLNGKIERAHQARYGYDDIEDYLAEGSSEEKLIAEFGSLSEKIFKLAHTFGKKEFGRVYDYIRKYNKLREEHPEVFRKYCEINGFDPRHTGHDCLG